jgi:hypothetical protein
MNNLTTTTSSEDILSQFQNLQITQDRTPEEVEAYITEITNMMECAKIDLAADLREEIEAMMSRMESRTDKDIDSWRDAFVEVALETQWETIVEEEK